MEHFARSYLEARSAFRALADEAGAGLETFVLPGWTGLCGEVLTTDVAWLGPKAPRGALVVTSGTHGVEGYAGSGFQCSLLTDGAARALPTDVALILVHAINPFGFSHSRRVNELNVDLNRNFIDFTEPLPESADYARLHEALVPAAWTGVARQQADETITQAWAAMGERGFQDVVCRGQYSHPEGLFYGGAEPSWSCQTWRGLLRDLPESIQTLAHIDIHTGLGPKGYGEILYTLPRHHPGLALARRWYEDLGFRAAGTRESAATEVRGTMNHAVIESAAAAEIMSISIEFGTVDFRRMFEALRTDNWHRMRAHAVPPEVREELLRCFCSPEPEWRESVLERCNRVFARTVAGVTASLRSGRAAGGR
jgi:Protein of unknown function (DUF2817)